MSEPTIDIDREDIQDALLAVYLSLQENQGFWRGWLSDRMGPMSSFFVGSDEEEKAAKSLGAALRELSGLSVVEIAPPDREPISVSQQGGPESKDL